MALDPTRYAWIIPPTTQFLDYDGKPLVGGHCVLYIHGTTGTPYTSYQNWNPGTPNPEQIPIDNIGLAPAIGANSNAYDLYVYNKFGSLVYSRLNLNTQSESGTVDINTDSTIHGNGSVSDPIGVNIPVVIDGLVRNVVGETDNVHTRVRQYLSDGSIIVGVSVDQTEYDAGFGIKIEDNVISLDPDANLNIDYLTAGSSTAIDGTNLNLNAYLKRARGDRVYLDSGVIKLKPGTYAVNAFIRINNAGYDLDPNIYNFSVYGGMVLDVPCRTIEYDNTFYHEEKYEISFLTINANEETDIPLVLTTNIKTLLANSNVYLDYIQVYNLNGIIGEGGGGGGGSSTDVEITSDDNSVTINQSTVEDTKVFDLSVRSVPTATSEDEGKILSVDDEGNPEWVDPQAYSQVQSDWDETNTSDPSYIQNKPDLDQYAKTADLAPVALSNDYTDLDNRPSIPVVNDGTLTIQKNGTTIDTFSANSSANKTVNVTVPTKTSDLQNDSGFITASQVPAQEQADWTESDSSDPAYIKNKPTIRNVPDVTSSDDSKVLKATYSGGVGSYSWETESGGENVEIIDIDNISTRFSSFNELFQEARSGKVLFIKDTLSTNTNCNYYVYSWGTNGGMTPTDACAVFTAISSQNNRYSFLSNTIWINYDLTYTKYGFDCESFRPLLWLASTIPNLVPAGTYYKNQILFVNEISPTSECLILYRCKLTYTANGTQTPYTDSTHWERLYLKDYINELNTVEIDVTPSNGALDLIKAYRNNVLISSGDITSITNSGDIDTVVIQWTVASSTALPTMPNGYHAASANPTSLTVGKTYQLSLLNDCYSIVEFG